MSYRENAATTVATTQKSSWWHEWAFAAFILVSLLAAVFIGRWTARDDVARAESLRAATCTPWTVVVETSTVYRCPNGRIEDHATGGTVFVACHCGGDALDGGR